MRFTVSLAPRQILELGFWFCFGSYKVVKLTQQCRRQGQRGEAVDGTVKQVFSFVVDWNLEWKFLVESSTKS